MKDINTMKLSSEISPPPQKKTCNDARIAWRPTACSSCASWSQAAVTTERSTPSGWSSNRTATAGRMAAKIGVTLLQNPLDSVRNDTSN